MLISCNSCESKYLLNSADLKPSGRTVKCANCGNQWHQEILLNDAEEVFEKTISSTVTNEEKISINGNSFTPNLPSTYVKEQQVSVANSILVILFVIIFISVFWFIRNSDTNNLILLKFYIDEFIFNLKLILDDIAKIIHQIIKL